MLGDGIWLSATFGVTFLVLGWYLTYLALKRRKKDFFDSIYKKWRFGICAIGATYCFACMAAFFLEMLAPPQTQPMFNAVFRSAIYGIFVLWFTVIPGLFYCDYCSVQLEKKRGK